eukprot:4627868-Heterocapsa_arctica.AAC.1
MTAAVTIGGTREEGACTRMNALSQTTPIGRLMFQRRRRFERRRRHETAYLARRMSLYSAPSRSSSADALGWA